MIMSPVLQPVCHGAPLTVLYLLYESLSLFFAGYGMYAVQIMFLHAAIWGE